MDQPWAVLDVMGKYLYVGFSEVEVLGLSLEFCALFLLYERYVMILSEHDDAPGAHALAVIQSRLVITRGSVRDHQ